MGWQGGDGVTRRCGRRCFSFQLAHGADPSLKNQEGQTPLDLSTVSSRVHLARLQFWRYENALSGLLYAQQVLIYRLPQ